MGRPAQTLMQSVVSSILTVVSCSVQDFKYQMVNKFSSIDNQVQRHKQYKDMRGEIYIITSPDSVWRLWRTVFERHESGDIIDPDTGLPFNKAKNFKSMRPLVREFFRHLQGLTENEMAKAATHILHERPTAKRPFSHPKIVFSKPKTFLPSCYVMKDWADNRKMKTVIVQELHKLVPDARIFVDGEIHGANWRRFKEEYNFTSASMAALMREAGEEYLKLKCGKVGKNAQLPLHSARAFNNFVKEKAIVKFEGDAHFNPVTLEPLKINGWPGIEARKAIRIRAKDRFPFALIDFRNIPGGSIEGAMSSPFYEPFITKFVDYGCPRFREVDVWLWIVEDRKSEQVYEIARKLHPDYVVSKSHYVAAPAEGAHSSLKEKKSKDANVLCLYFVYKAEILKMQNHPVLKMDNLFQVPDGAGDNKALYEESKYALYHADELRMDFYLKMMKLLTRRGDCIFNVFGGSKPMFAALVSNPLYLFEGFGPVGPNFSTFSTFSQKDAWFGPTGPNHTSFCNVYRSELIVSNTCVFLV